MKNNRNIIIFFLLILSLIICGGIYTYLHTNSSFNKSPQSNLPKNNNVALLHMEGAETRIYKTIDGTNLALYIFNPETRDGNRPAVIFFFGGGWTNGSPDQFEQQSRYLASRGMVAITADYRIGSKEPGTTIVKCVNDAKSAVRYVREHAKELGIDPNRIAAGGLSAGGQLAAATGMIPGQDESTENLSISSKPNAMILFSPLLVMAPLNGYEISQKYLDRISVRRAGIDPVEISPANHVVSGIAPTIIFHGESDATVPISTIEDFVELMKKVGNKIEFERFPNQPHGFASYRNGKNPMFYNTLTTVDKFLTSLGWLEGQPSVNSFFNVNYK